MFVRMLSLSLHIGALLWNNVHPNRGSFWHRFCNDEIISCHNKPHSLSLAFFLLLPLSLTISLSLSLLSHLIVSIFCLFSIIISRLLCLLNNSSVICQKKHPLITNTHTHTHTHTNTNTHTHSHIHSLILHTRASCQILFEVLFFKCLFVQIKYTHESICCLARVCPDSRKRNRERINILTSKAFISIWYISVVLNRTGGPCTSRAPWKGSRPQKLHALKPFSVIWEQSPL